jgi:hypothetical protein
MKKNALMLFFLAMTIQWSYSQIIYEDFEGGVATLNWTAPDGTYNGVVENPAPNDVNNSEFCGSYTKSGNHSFSLFWVQDLGFNMDLSQYNQFKIQINATAATSLLLKFEGPGVPAIEQAADIPVANEWVELTFDMSAAAGNTGLNRIILFFDPGNEESADTYLFDNLIAVESKICYEDFSGGSAQLNWLALDGEYEEAVENPGPNQINDSEFVGRYVKSGNHAFSLFLAELDEPLDLSVNNQITLQVYATAPTQILMKLEGPGGAIERIRNIAVINAWQEYTFDFSAAADNDGLNKIILFFDPGVETSADAYFFDKLCAVPQGACAGVAVDPLIIDDFECQRNATYGQGWDILNAVDNPAPSAVNSSTKVGRYEDPLDEWSALVIDYHNAIDLSTLNQISAKVWAPKAGPLLFKLEGGNSAPREIFMQITEVGTWVDYTADFSDQASADHKRIVIFFNAGVTAEEGDVYFVDDIRRSEKATAVIEDFEDGLSLGWQPLDQNEVLNGIFNGPVANPNPGGSNTSDNVGCYTKGSSPFSTLQAFSLDPFDLSVNAQFNIDVLAPEGSTGTIVRMFLSSPLSGNREAEATISTPGEWETLSFDFSAFSSITDFAEVRLIFDPGTASPGQTWCFDNITQGAVTIDPCEGVVAIPNIIDDFECQRNYEYGAGAERIRAINNPHLTAQNGSLRVGEYRDPANDPWAALTIEFPDGIDLSVYNQFQFQVYSPVTAPILVKLEGGSSPAVEIFTEVSMTDFWERIQVDFSEHIGSDFRRVAFFFNAGVDAPETTIFIDNIRWGRESFFGCISDYETQASSISNFIYFANGSLEAQGYQFEVVDNPNPTGINESNRVGKFIKAGDGAPFAGMYADLDAAIDFKDGPKIMKAHVHMDHIGNFAVKLEGSATGQPPVELPVANTVVDEWQELEYDFSAVADNAEYRRITLFFDLGIDATGEDVTSYFDNLVVGDGECVPTTSIRFRPIELETLKVAPNPASDQLMIEHLTGIVRIEIISLTGKRMASLIPQGEGNTWINVNKFQPGMYILTGFDSHGNQKAVTRFVKQ